MITHILWLGLLSGIIHTAATGVYYGNPVVDVIYANAMAEHPGVRSWSGKRRYLMTQIAGTQGEI